VRVILLLGDAELVALLDAGDVDPLPDLELGFGLLGLGPLLDGSLGLPPLPNR
jgi:hypothetical protein